VPTRTTDTIRARFAHLAASSDADLDVEEGAILIAAEEYPDLDVDAVIGEFDMLGAEARSLLAGSTDPVDRIERLNRFLFDELGFEGASEYFDPRNSYLNDVLERRVGIPITLALVYIAVGRRVGLDVRGVSFPGHFLVKCAGTEERIIDAFHGRTLSRTDCESRLAAAFGPGVALQPEDHFRDATPREILVRMLGNLQRIFAERADPDRLLSCCDRIVLLTPRSAHALRDRAVVYQRLGWMAAAISDLDSALELAEDAQLARSLEKRRNVLRQRMGLVH
jgi:regulator of sirC expression with transglutaminase-like and TPR domain